MEYVGLDKNDTKLQLGDICVFTIDNVKYEGMVMYDESEFAFVFEMRDDKFPSVLMRKADLGSIEKIISVYSTYRGDEYEFYREVFGKPL